MSKGRIDRILTSDTVASVSLNDADRDPRGFADELGRSFEEYGFAIVRDHGIPQELIDRAEAKAKAFFALPEAVKRAYLIPGGGGARGYTAFGVETAKGGTASDLKEFWHVGRELAAGHKFREVMADMSGQPRSTDSARPSLSCTMRSTRRG